MSFYNRHLEYTKNEANIHAQTGDALEKIIADIYVYNDRIEVWGYGYVDKFRPTDRISIDQMLINMQEVFEDEGYSLTFDEVANQLNEDEMEL